MKKKKKKKKKAHAKAQRRKEAQATQTQPRRIRRLTHRRELSGDTVGVRLIPHLIAEDPTARDVISATVTLTAASGTRCCTHVRPDASYLHSPTVYVGLAPT
jgi:hypothetical protein